MSEKTRSWSRVKTVSASDQLRAIMCKSFTRQQRLSGLRWVIRLQPELSTARACWASDLFGNVGQGMQFLLWPTVIRYGGCMYILGGALTSLSGMMSCKCLMPAIEQYSNVLACFPSSTARDETTCTRSPATQPRILACEDVQQPLGTLKTCSSWNSAWQANSVQALPEQLPRGEEKRRLDCSA